MLLPQNNRLKLMEETIKDLTGSLNPFLVLLVMITLFWLWFPKQLFPVMAKLRADTMPTLKPNVKLSTCAPLMASEVFPNILSCAPMEPSLTKLISFVIGGLTLIVLKPKDSTVGTMKSLLNNKLTQLQLMHQILTKATLPLKHLLMTTQQEKDVKAADKEDADKEDVEETKKISKKSVKSPQLISNLLKKN
jgi:hypothetical protein